MPRTEQKLTYTIFVGGQPVEQLTPEQIDRMAERIGEAMSTYYTAHPDEYRKIASKKKQTNQ